MDENALSNLIIGAAIEVHEQLGPGLLENAYQAAMECEMSLRKIPYECQKLVPVVYKGYPLKIDYRLDFLVGNLVVVELKAVVKVDEIHTAQVLTYLKLTGCKLGMLLNFNVPLMKEGIYRIVHNLPEPYPNPPKKSLKKVRFSSSSK